MKRNELSPIILNGLSVSKGIAIGKCKIIEHGQRNIEKLILKNNEDIKKELISKLEEFATPSESLEEIFENKEQIEVSKFYEKLPKAHAIAIDNWLNEKIYHRKPEKS